MLNGRTHFIITTGPESGRKFITIPFPDTPGDHSPAVTAVLAYYGTACLRLVYASALATHYSEDMRIERVFLNVFVVVVSSYPEIKLRRAVYVNTVQRTWPTAPALQWFCGSTTGSVSSE
ncbi:hypothetical protein DPEC_G00174720 [Dallia pectoralis]|uniref:Uncharacterized protein n=1 Tax=Dallia pectoralis TaxID=75939 RepID=A0ACC2GE00_DALPE|nr:hypothetical protein DPEC_G00174720 [Dallia pectoralis]